MTLESFIRLQISQILLGVILGFFFFNCKQCKTSTDFEKGKEKNTSNLTSSEALQTMAYITIDWGKKNQTNISLESTGKNKGTQL